MSCELYVVRHYTYHTGTLNDTLAWYTILP